MTVQEELTKERLKETTRESFLNKRIILFGTGTAAKEFYQKYKGILSPVK